MTSASTIWREWRVPMVALLATVFFIPMRRYTLPSSLPFHLEPYRPIIALVIGLWVLALLAARVTLRRTSIGAPIKLFLFAVLLSLVLNTGSIISETYKSLSLFATFLLAFVLIVSVVRRQRDIDTFVKILVAFGAVLGVLGVIEARTGFSLFSHLDRVLPFLEPLPVAEQAARGARSRSFASAEHPIALGALLMMLLPFSIYLGASTKRLVWWGCCAALAIGAMSTVSRTAVVALGVEMAMIAAVRWNDVRRLWPLVFLSWRACILPCPAPWGPCAVRSSPRAA